MFNLVFYVSVQTNGLRSESIKCAVTIWWTESILEISVSTSRLTLPSSTCDPKQSRAPQSLLSRLLTTNSLMMRTMICTSILSPSAPSKWTTMTNCNKMRCRTRWWKSTARRRRPKSPNQWPTKPTRTHHSCAMVQVAPLLSSPKNDTPAIYAPKLSAGQPTWNAIFSFTLGKGHSSVPCAMPPSLVISCCRSTNPKFISACPPRTCRSSTATWPKIWWKSSRRWGS